jgi:TRAP-type mannitol/chloroaromatic compound transport system substrate-binding protein
MGGTAAAATAAGGLPAPAISQGYRELKMVTSWPKNSPGLQTSAERLAQSITALSDGRLKVTVYPADSLVHAFEVFDAVGVGVADMYHASDYYFGAKSPALYFFCAVPYGLTADEMCSWIDFRRRPDAMGRGRCAVQHQALDGSQYRRPDGRLVQQANKSPGRL